MFAAGVGAAILPSGVVMPIRPPIIVPKTFLYPMEIGIWEGMRFITSDHVDELVHSFRFTEHTGVYPGHPDGDWSTLVSYTDRKMDTAFGVLHDNSKLQEW